MAKKMYKIPAGLDASYGDLEIAIQTKDGLGARPLPIKVILTYVGSLVLLFYVCTHGIVSHGSPIQIGLFIIIWIAFTFVFARFDKTKRMQVQLIPTLLSYIQPQNRRVVTRMKSNAMNFCYILGIDKIDEDTGMIHFLDGTYGLAYRVVGSASVLLFDEDRDAILDRVDAFYRKIGTDCEFIYITTKESQKVYRQVANLKRRYDALNVDDPDLKAVANEQYRQLHDYVGSVFKSIHQYLIVKGDNKEALFSGRNVVQSESENSDLMLKQIVPMDYGGVNDINEIFHTIYRK